MTEARTLPPCLARIVSVPLYQGSPRLGASLPRGRGPTASAVAAFGAETSLHSAAPQTFAELIFVAVKPGGYDTALDGTSRGSTAAAASSQWVLGIPASNRRLTTIPAPRGTRSTSSDARDPEPRSSSVWVGPTFAFRPKGQQALSIVASRGFDATTPRRKAGPTPRRPLASAMRGRWRSSARSN